MLKEIVSERLKETFGSAVYIDLESQDFAVFAAKHPTVGDVIITENYDELIVSVGTITHGHFASYESGLTEAEQATAITYDLVNFLQGLFADRYLLFKASWGGGWVPVEEVVDKKLRSPKRKWFKWSAPIDVNNDFN
jgi:hypothetical protein